MRLTAHVILTQIAKGNAGAELVVTDLLSYGNGAKQAMKLKEMGITGALLWLCYSDMLNCDMDKLYKLIQTNRLKGEILLKRSQDKRFDQNWEFYEQRSQQKEVNET